jgi:serine/threonine protein kinase
VADTTPKTCQKCHRQLDEGSSFCPDDGTPLVDTVEADPLVGTAVGHDIVLTNLLGAGAMGRVYRGHQRGVGRDVAVKVLHRELTRDPRLAQRFQREARIASRLQHPHVVEVHLAGQLADGALYIVMELLDGVSLAAALLAAGGSFPLERALGIALQICDAMGEAHANDVIHRDLKPDNIMLIRRADTTDWVKILDFGIAKGNVGGLTMETAAGLIFGTARYISPEGAQGAAVVPASDVYSLATILFEMLAGHAPFVAENGMALLVKHIHDPPPELRAQERAHDVPLPIARVIMRNLMKLPAERSPNARAFGLDLAAAARDAGIALPEIGTIGRMSHVAGLTPALAPTLIEVAPQPEPDPSFVKPVTTLGGMFGEELSQSPLPVPARWPKGTRLVLALALGVTATLGAQHFLGRDDAALDALTERARHAMTERRYVAPPGNNVRDIVASGLERWPHDPTLEELRSRAARDLITRAMAARAGGDVDGARDAALKAVALDAGSQSARLLSEEYAEESRSLATPAGRSSGAPRVVVESPAHARPQETIAVTFHVLPRSAGAGASIEDATLTLLDLRGSATGTSVPVEKRGAGDFEAHLVVPGDGRFFLVFRASVANLRVSAERAVDVAP